MAQADPRRGEVWIIDTGWQRKVRPCLILSVRAHDQDRDLVTYIPRTTSARGSRFEVAIDAPYFQRPGVFDVHGVGTISRAKLQSRIGELAPEQVAEVEAALCRWLGLLAVPRNPCPDCSNCFPVSDAEGEESGTRIEVYLHRDRPNEKQLVVYTCLSCGKAAAIRMESSENSMWIYPPESWTESELE
ncbi:MAG: type II toxin-antitoxin system PemK/MazF family toxin [Planctomycetia bacterium]|nr:type II toxin-antitoxin system PemK/MazF family toxin [Planctomycetia bacterium]